MLSNPKTAGQYRQIFAGPSRHAITSRGARHTNAHLEVGMTTVPELLVVTEWNFPSEHPVPVLSTLAFSIVYPFSLRTW